MPSGETTEYTEQHHAVTLIGGDQLTVARARGAQKIRSNSFKSEDRLDGLLPVAEDWHSKICLLQVTRLVNYLFCHLHVPFSFQVVWNRLQTLGCKGGPYITYGILSTVTMLLRSARET